MKTIDIFIIEVYKGVVSMAAQAHILHPHSFRQGAPSINAALGQ